MMDAALQGVTFGTLFNPHRIYLSCIFSQRRKKKLTNLFLSSTTTQTGALATVDRNYGVVLNTLHHHIADTHVAHHLFSGMPHYHATEATAALKPVLGDYYQSDSRWIGRALWEDWVFCRYVAPDDDDGSGGSSGGSSGSSGGSGVLWQRK